MTIKPILVEGGTTVNDTPNQQVPDERRDFSLGSVFGVALAFISPIIALYAIFDLGIGIAGPSFWWAFAVVLAGQLLVALIFGELSSRWPEEGGVYAWAGRLIGPRFGWFAGWTYTCTLVSLNAAAAFAASTFAATLFGIDEADAPTRLLLALGFIAVATSINVIGRRLLKIFIALSIACEVLASLFVGTYLLLFHRNNDLSVIFDGFSQDGTTFALGPFLAAVAVVGWALIGFESAGDLAAEVKNPQRNVPIAQIGSLVLVAATVMYAGLALILAIPDLDAVAKGEVDDAILFTLTENLGAAVKVPISLIVCIGFTAGIAAVSMALSRVVHAMASARALPAAALLERRSPRDGMPRAALVASSVATGISLIAAVLGGFYDVMISMSTGGFYIAFLMPVAAMLYVRLRKAWTAATFNLGTVGGLVINIAAALWLIAQIINISWPRDIGQPWYVEWGCLLMYAAVGITGTLLLTRLNPAKESNNA